MLYLDTIFPRFFSAFDKRTDTSKDINDKGTLERFNEVIGKDIDDNVIPPIRDLMQNIYQPTTAQDQLIPYLESMFGLKRVERNLYFAFNIAVRRRVLQAIPKLHSIRGTRRGYEVCFEMQNVSMVLTESPAGFGYDSPGTLDDDVRRFDSACPTCSYYDLALTGAAPMTSQLQYSIASIIEFNEPIHARLKTLTYNGTPVDVGYPTDSDFVDFAYDFLI